MEAASPSAFIARPVGRYVAGPRSVVYCATPSLIGSAFWGRPGEADAQQCVPLYDCIDSPQVERACDVVTDTGRVTGADPDAYRVFFEYLRGRQADYAGRVRRWALIVAADTLAGAAVAGSFQQLEVQHPLRVFTSAAEAFAWLERPDAELRCAEIEALVTRTIDVPPLLRRVREQLAVHSREGLGRTARALAVSPRALQRALQQANTSFREESVRARVVAAAALLADTDLGIKVIALRVGCSSASHFCAMFARLMGESPSRYRARHRGEGRD